MFLGKYKFRKYKKCWYNLDVNYRPITSTIHTDSDFQHSFNTRLNSNRAKILTNQKLVRIYGVSTVRGLRNMYHVICDGEEGGLLNYSRFSELTNPTLQ